MKDKIIITVRGGCVEEVFAASKLKFIGVEILDYDNIYDDEYESVEIQEKATKETKKMIKIYC